MTPNRSGLQGSTGQPKRRLPTILLAAVVALCSFCTTACWDKRELEDEAWALGMGIDKAEDGLIEITARVAIPRKIGRPGSEGSGGDGEGFSSTTVLASTKANTILGGIGLLNTFLSREVSFLHCSSVIFGEDAAKDGLRKYLDELASYREFRRTVFPFVAVGKAKDFMIENISMTENDPAKYVNSISGLGRKTGMSPHFVNLHHLIEDIINVARDPHMMVIAINPAGGPRPTGNNAQTTGATTERKAEADFLAGEMPRQGGGESADFSGIAVFSGDKMVGILTAAETRALLLVNGMFRETLMSIPDPLEAGEWISLRLTEGRRPKVTTTFRNGQPQVVVRVSLEGDLIGVQGLTDYVEPDGLSILNRSTAEFIKAQIKGVFEKLGEWNSDPIGYGNSFRKYFRTYEAWKKTDWRDVIRSGKIDVEVNVRLRRVGLQMEAPKVGIKEGVK